MKIAIVGSRNFSNLALVRAFVQELPRDTEIVSGGGRGVDTVAVEEATALGMPTKVFPAEWEKYGKAAGFRRNIDIVSYADEVVAFWNGESRGTKHAMELARMGHRRLTVIYPGVAL